MSVFETVILIIAVITVFIGLSIVWSTLTLGISPMPSSSKARQAMLKLMDETLLETSTETTSETRAGPIFELGSGWGGLLIPLAKKYPRRKIVAYELSILPWLTTLIWIKILALKNVKLVHQNFLNADLSNASVIFCYLYSGGMKALEAKFDEGDKNVKIKYLVSNNFVLPSHKPVKTIHLDDLYKSPVYLYKFK